VSLDQTSHPQEFYSIRSRAADGGVPGRLAKTLGAW
jgi:hypothetical protein